MGTSADLHRHYSRTDHRGHFPVIAEAPEIAHNRLALYWRPLIDLTPVQRAPLRLTMIQPVAEWLAKPVADRVCWFSRIGVNGLRSQVVRHAGLNEYDCRVPSDLPRELRTPAWERLVDALGRFRDLDPYMQALIMFHLAQLTFGLYAKRLAGVVSPTGEPGYDHYAYNVARILARLPGHAHEAMPVFQALTQNRHDPALGVLAAAQGVGQGVRSLGDVSLSQRFEQAAQFAAARAAGWLGHLALSRFHRAVALLRIAEKDPGGMRAELREAWHHHDEMTATAPDGMISQLIINENRLIIIESEIKSVFRVDEPETRHKLTAFADELLRLDPYCVETLIVAGDGYAVAGDWAIAAQLYSRAGELGTTAGATAWYRAGQCYVHLGENDRAVNAMGRCLELDTTAVEPREYLIAQGAAHAG
jgi:hypothetical protein